MKCNRMLDIQKYIGAPKIVVDKVDDTVTRFEVNYLPRGFGHTLGNAMRRIMLGYDLGGSITGMKIKDVAHEYETIDGVRETVVDMMLHFKKLRFKIDEWMDTLIRAPQKFTWVGTISSDDVKVPAGVEMLDKGTYLFEITDPGTTVVMDIRIEKGYGYYSIDFLKNRDKQDEAEDVNMILVDNDFRIVDYIKYEVEEIIDDFHGSTKDSLIIEVKTKYDTVSPKDFMAFAGEVLASYSKLFIFDEVYIDKSVLVELNEIKSNETQAAEEMDIKTMPIDALPLSERTRNALIKNNILYVEDLEKKKKGELLLMKGVGRKAIEEISAALHNIDKALAW